MSAPLQTYMCLTERLFAVELRPPPEETWPENWEAVYKAADVAQVLDECRQVLAYLVERHEASKTRAVTVDWNKAARLLAQLGVK